VVRQVSRSYVERLTPGTSLGPPAPTWFANQNYLSGELSTLSACEDCVRLLDTVRLITSAYCPLNSYYDAAGVVQCKKRRWEAITASHVTCRLHIREHQ